MGRDAKKIETIAVDAVSQEVNRHELLQPELATNDKTLSFDGHINVFKAPQQKKENHSGRVPVQVKGREVATFKRDKCSFQVDKTDLDAYMRESGVIFFVVEILKESNDTKIFWKQLLPYDLNKVLHRIEKKQKKSGFIELVPLEGQDLTVICQNFIEDQQKQKHGKIKMLFEIEGLRGFSISAITDRFGTKEQVLADNILAFNDHILAKKPLYLNADIGNDLSIPVANITDGDCILAMQDYAEVWVDNRCFGSRYFSRQINLNGCYYQFGQSSKLFPDGRMRFSSTGTLDEMIKDVEFVLAILNGGKIRIGDSVLPCAIQEHGIHVNEIEQKLVVLQTTKRVLDFLGVNSSVDIGKFNENDYRKIYALSEYVIHGKACPVMFKKEGINVLKIGPYHFTILTYPKNIVNIFSGSFWQNASAFCHGNDGTRFDLSPYYLLNTEVIAKSSNWNPAVVIESIRAIPFSEPAGVWYTNLLLETIKAIDIAPGNGLVTQFANDLADYLCENEDTIIHRLNKQQIKKRLNTLDVADNTWLRAEQNKQDEPKILCGIAILLGDHNQFDAQFARLTQKQQSEFREYPIMTLIEKQIQPKKPQIKCMPSKSTKRGRLANV